MAGLRLPSVMSAFAHRDFRFFWSGGAMSVSGRQTAMVAQAWLLYDITGSALQLGLLGFVRAVPAFVLGLAGGVIADRIDRRRLMIVTTAGSATVWAGLATLTLLDMVEVWHILGTTVIVSMIGAFEGPSRGSMFPHLIERRNLTNAVALNSSIDPAVRMFTPIIAGLLIDRVGGGYAGPAAALYLVGAYYAMSSFFMYLVHMPSVQRSVGGGLHSLGEGISYLRSNGVLSFLLVMAFVHGFAGMAYTTLLPVFATEISETSSGSVLGLLFTAGGIGGFVGAIVTGGLRSSSHQGRMVVAAGAMFGSSLIAFAYSPWVGLSFASLFVASMSNNVFGVVAQSVLHGRVPDQYRGRVMGFWWMQFTVVHPLGSLQIGIVATAIGAAPAVAIGGAVVVAFALLVAGTNHGIRALNDRSRSADPLDTCAQAYGGAAH